jgi:hypothetical protein
MKHGFDCLYNHIAKAAFHAITTRGECVGSCAIAFNRMVSGRQAAFQGWHHNIIGNYVRTSTGIQLTCEYRLSPTTKITRASRYCRLIGNDANQVVLGESRSGKNLRVIAPLKNVTIEAHTGKFVRYVSEGSFADIAFDAEGHPPGGFPLFDRATILRRAVTNVPLVEPPVLSDTICGPASTRGKVWDR